jgi:N-methylhydantoinase A
MTSPPLKKSALVRVGVDTGGTFTDFVFQSDGRLQVFKVASTPTDPSIAIIDGLQRISGITGSKLQDMEVVHGTTVGTNALLQRRGARTALITTKGFEDVLAIGRQARPELYNLDAIRPPPLVPDDLRLGIRERVTASGEVLETVDEVELASIAAELKEAGVESVAICLLFSFVHPEHEQHIADVLSLLELPLSISHKILPEYREYERTSTVVINAYLQPLMSNYLHRLMEDSRGEVEQASVNNQRAKTKVQRSVIGLRVMQSSGGSISAAAAADEPVRTILSGPAGGVVGALRAARVAGFKNIITFDMGGTSTDVALCDVSGPSMTNEAIVAGLPVAVSVMDIHTVGAGGGSIARVDAGGSLRVGPESAGADPGPACYGRSFLPTVTDAHVVLGHFGGAGLLGGEFELDHARAAQALAKLAIEMSQVTGRRVTAIQAAQGVISVVNTNMERALRRISVERGHDTRDFALLPFGGAGGLHAVELARALRIPRLIAPTAAGALSAIGVVMADVVTDRSRTVLLDVQPGIEKKLESVFKEMERTARTALRREGFANDRQRHERLLAARYKGQSFELEIKHTKGDISGSFHRAHQTRYGYAQQRSTVEVVSTRLRSVGVVERFKDSRIAVARQKRLAKPLESRLAYFEGKKHRVAIYQRDKLLAGMQLVAPCIVTEYSATTLIPSGAQASVDAFGNLITEID